MPQGNLVCNCCGFVCYSASKPENLVGGCPHCGAEKHLLRRLNEYDRVVAFDEEFVYDKESFSAMIAGLTSIYVILKDQYIRAFIDVMENLGLSALQQKADEISLEGKEILIPRLKTILFALRRFDLELPENDNMLKVGVLREDISILLGQPAT